MYATATKRSLQPVIDRMNSSASVTKKVIFSYTCVLVYMYIYIYIYMLIHGNALFVGYCI